MRINSNTSSAAGGRGVSLQNAGGDKVIQDIEKQIERLEERIREIAANEDTPKEIKMEQQNLLREQIAQLRQQIFTRRRELQQEKMEVEAPKQPAPETAGQDVSMSGGQMQAFAQAGTAMTQINAKDHVRTGLEGEAKKLGFEISLDSARGLDVTDKLTALSSIENKINSVTKDMTADMTDTVELFDDAAERDAKSEKSEDEDAAMQAGVKQDGSDSARTGHVDTFA